MLPETASAISAFLAGINDNVTGTLGVPVIVNIAALAAKGSTTTVVLEAGDVRPGKVKLFCKVTTWAFSVVNCGSSNNIKKIIINNLLL